MKTAALGKGLTIINEYTFNNCPRLKTVKLSEGLQVIGTGAFGRNYRLQTINIPSTVTTIRNNAFEQCDELKEVSLSGVKIIGDEAFYGCETLSRITLGDTVASVGTSAFAGCDNLKTIYISEKVNELGYDCLPNWDDVTIYSYKGSVADDYAKDNSITIKYVSALKNTSTLSASTVKLGNSIKVNAKSTGGFGIKKYEIYYKLDTATSWTKAQSYSTNTTKTITPKNAGKYTVSIKVKDEKGKVVKKQITLEVTK